MNCNTTHYRANSSSVPGDPTLSLPLGQIAPELRTALMVPTYTAAAHAHKKLAADLQADLQAALKQAETWAQSEYAPALAKRDTLTEAERQAVLDKLSRFTGVAVSDLDPKTLGIGMAQFAQRLLHAEKKVVGHYDSRLTGPVDPTQTQYDPTKDPSLQDIIDDDGVVRYLRTELNFKSDLQYQGPFGGGYPPATSFRGDWMSVKWVRPGATGTGQSGTGVPAGGTGQSGTGVPAGGPAAPEQPLRRAMSANPSMKVLSACGYYDLVCAYAANAHVAKALEPAIRDNVTAKAYVGGHAIYTDRAARLQMKNDVAAFVQAASATPVRKP